jgi:beta-glucosidase
MSLEEKVGQMQNSAPAIPRLNIPAYDWWNEALHGVARAGLATVFPQAIGLAATWDTNLQRRMADVISTEARAKYNDAIEHDVHKRYYGLTFWSPNINIFRDPRWGRGQETYGEDPYLTAQMAIQFIQGMQGDDPHYFKTIATSKHYAVHSGPELLRHGFNVNPSEQDLLDTYLYAFRQTVEKAKVDSVMCVYNAVNGIPGCASDLLLQHYLRDEWKFTGYVVSDCDAVDDIYTGHHFSASAAEASAKAVKAGTDLDCGRTYNSLVDAVHQGLTSEDEINRSVERLFVARFRLGMFDPPSRVPFSKIGMDQVQSAEHRKVALEVAEKSIVLLKNDNNLLPLTRIPKKIVVIGPAADDPDAMLGNYNGFPLHIVTPLEGIQKEFGKKSSVQFALGSTYAAGWTALVPENVLTPAGSKAKTGLLVEYFANEDFNGKPILSRVEPRAYFNTEMRDPTIVKALPPDRYSVRWSGTLQVNQAGEYRLGAIRPECHACGRTDSASVYVDDKLVATDGQRADEEMQSKTAAITLDTGKEYKLRVEYKQHGGGGGLQLLWTPPADAALKDAVDLASKSDLNIVCVGLNSRLEGEESRLKIPGFEGGDRSDIRLPEAQRKLLEAIFATGKPTVIVLVNGSALAIQPANQNAQAILEAWYGGESAGTAIAETLSGKNNPAGRLPVTFYESLDQLPAFTDYSMNNRTYRFFTGQVLYPFGYGLSYSIFQYTEPKVSGTSITAQVTNASSREGDEVAELYLTKHDGSNPMLRGFERVHLKPGEKHMLQFEVSQEDLQDRVVHVDGGLPSK